MRIAAAAVLALAWAGPQALPREPGPEAPAPRPLSHEQLLTEVQRRAFRFFWERTDPRTGLADDRASNFSARNNYTVASIASTGYALASLPIAVERGWIGRTTARDRALLTLRFLNRRFPHKRGWCYHFVDRRTGQRVWKSEISSVDTSLMVLGALMAGQYWRGTQVERLANALYDRMDWTWMRTNGGQKPGKLLVSHGWRPEEGFLKNDWGRYCELMLIYLLGMGAAKDPLPAESWTAWERDVVEYRGRTTLAGGPIFMHQMAHGFFDFRGRRDILGWDYWVASREAVLINRQFALDRAGTRKTYGPAVWGLNAGDGPDGYRAYGGPGEEDGTVSPTGAIASILFTPDLARQAAWEMHRRFGGRIWGRYGFSNGFNLDRNWHGPDVIGIDLGMALLAIEDARTGLPWRLMRSHPFHARAFRKAGFRVTREPQPRPLRIAPPAAGQPRAAHSSSTRTAGRAA